jgi:hypothetical protein
MVNHTNRLTQSSTPSSIPQGRNLRYVFCVLITNVDMQWLILHAPLRSKEMLGTWLGVEFGMDTDEGKANSGDAEWEGDGVVVG